MLSHIYSISHHFAFFFLLPSWSRLASFVTNTAQKWGDYHVREKDERDLKQAETEVDANEVISKFNHHATLVLHPPKNGGGDVKLASSSAGLPQDNPTVATELEELHEPLPPETRKLVLQNSTAYDRITGGVERGQTTTSRSMNGSRVVAAIRNEPVHVKDGELKSSDCCILKHNPILSNGLTDPLQALEIIASIRTQVDMNANVTPAAYQQVCDDGTNLYKYMKPLYRTNKRRLCMC